MATNPNMIPAINTRGLYTLRAPFAAALLVSTPYTCVAVRKLEDIVAAGGDPKELYYTAHGIDASVYDDDVAQGTCIVTLQASEGSIVYVPSSFITSLPDQGGIPYTTLVLAVSLSAIPDALDLTYLKTRMSELVMANLGVEAEVQEVAISAPTHLSQTEHAAIEAARQVNITNRTTDHATNLALTTQRDALLAKVQELEAYIQSL